MKDEDKTRIQLIEEISALRREVEELKAARAGPGCSQDQILAAVLENLSEGIIVTDLNSRIIYVNRSTEQLSGYSRTELIGKLPGILNGEGEAASIQEEIVSCMKRPGRWCRELIQKHRDGGTYLAELEIFSVFRDGRPVAWASIQRDISRRRQAENAACQSEKRFYRAFNACPMAMAISTIDEGRFVEVNDSFRRIIGYDQREVSGRTPAEIGIFSRSGFSRICRVLKKEGEFQNFEAHIRTRSGRLLFGLFSAHPIEHENKKYLMTIFNDITDRKQAEDQISRLNSFLCTIIDNANVWLEVLDQNGNVVIWNKAAEKISGYPNHEVVGHGRIWEWLYPDGDYRNTILAKTTAIIQKGETAEDFKTTILTKSGEKKIISWNSVRLQDEGGTTIGSVAFGRDVTEQEKIRDDLFRSREILRLVTDNTQDMICLTDADLNVRYSSPSFRRTLGILPGETNGRRLPVERVHPGDRASVHASIENLQKTGSQSPFSFRFRHAEGHYLWFESSGSVVLDKDSCPVGIVLSARDITARKQAEEAIKNSERFLANIFESIQDRLSIIDTEFNIIRTNGKVEEYYPWEVPLAGKKCYRAYHGLDNVCEGCPSLIALQSGMSAQAIIPVRERGGKITGWLDHSSYPFIDTATGRLKGVIVYARDITEKLKMEQEMTRLERFHLIGQMAAGIGHEIRNPMTSVRGFLQLLGNKKEYTGHREYFDLMLSELDRANAIIKEYLSLARNKPVNLVERSLNDVLEVLRPLIMAEAMSAGVDLAIEKGDVPVILLNDNEIRQLILNLVKNGMEAMANGGTLVIKTFTDDGETVLLVQDHGSGISPELADKIGTPFFTTKEKGTGLGLAVCYGIASRHNASITLDTGPGGSTFLVRFGRQK